MADYTGTTGNDVADHSDDDYRLDKTWDYSQGGSDTLTAGGASDTFFMGSAFWFAPHSATVSPNDTIDGGAGFDTFELAGNYATYYVRPTRFTPGYTAPTELVLTASSLHDVETIKLDEGSGFGYHIKLDAATFTSLGTIDASSLTSASAVIDGSAATAQLVFETGSASYALTGGAGNDSFELSQGFVSGDAIDGGAGDDLAILDTIYGAAALNLPDAAFANIQSFRLVGAQAYTVTAADAQTAAGAKLTIDASAAQSLQFDGSAERDGRFYVVGTNGSDMLTGGAGNDTLYGSGYGSAGSDTLSGGAGDDTLTAAGNGSQHLDGGDGNDIIRINAGNAFIDGGAGDDLITVAVAPGATVRVDGGAGTDTVALRPSVNQPVTIDSGVLQNIEALALTYDFASATDRFSVIWKDGILTTAQILPVSVVSYIAYDFDGSAEMHGAFVFTLPSGIFDGNAAGDHWSGGAGNDVFLALDPAFDTGASNVWNGGGGSNTLDYTRSGTAVTVDAVAGTATGSGSIVDTFTDFQIFDFGFGDNGFAGADGAERLSALQAGEETFRTGGGNDTVALGATFDAFDLIDGGAGRDTLVLDGDYAAGVTFKGATLTNVETLRLTAGHGYTLTSHEATVAAGATLTVDGSALGKTDALSFNGSAETDGTFVLRGGAGTDTLTGGAGADLLTGGRGADVLTGGGGADVFAIATHDTGRSKATADLLTDLHRADGDRIDLSQLDADTGTAGTQHFTFVGRAAFSGHAGELRVATHGAETWLSGDTYGDGRTDVLVRLAGHTPIGARDLILTPLAPHGAEPGSDGPAPAAGEPNVVPVERTAFADAVSHATPMWDNTHLWQGLTHLV